MGTGSDEARLQGREDYFAALPPLEASRGRRSTSGFYAWNLVRRHDPNHLILGLRFGGGVPPSEMLRACKAFDVYSLNVYSTQIDVKRLEEIYRLTGRPIIVGEFHFGVPERGLAPGLVQVRDQAERGVA